MKMSILNHNIKLQKGIARIPRATFVERCGAVRRPTQSDREPDWSAPRTPRRPSVMPALYRTISSENPAIDNQLHCNSRVPGESAGSPSVFFLHLFCKRIFRDVIRFFMGRMPFLSPNQQCHSSTGHSKHWPQPVAWTHPFFMHHRTPQGKRITPIMPVLKSQNPYHQHYTLQNETNAMLLTFNLLNNSFMSKTTNLVERIWTASDWGWWKADIDHWYRFLVYQQLRL